MMTSRGLFLFAVILAASARDARADVDLGKNWKLIGDADVAAGQYFFKNQSESVGAYTNVNLQQAKSFSSDSGLYFTEQSNFNGFKQVTDLPGGGIVFQQEWTNSFGAKYIKRYEGGYSLKPRLGFTWETFKETSDESLGKGLYDFMRPEAGLTWERKTRLGVSTPWTYQLSFDYYYTHYPHLTSLSSSFGAALSAPDPGKHLLDAQTFQFSYRSDFDLPDFQSVWALSSLALIGYTDQKIVNQVGEYLGSKRNDDLLTLSGGYSKRLTDFDAPIRIRPIVGLSLTENVNSSNQNNFDTNPSLLQYEGGYYNYFETHVSPAVNFLFLNTLINTRLTYDWSYRQYTGRLTQNADQTYNHSHLYQMIHTLVAEVSYPLLQNLDVNARLIYASAGSNTHYEQVFIYNYWTTNYYVGLLYRL